jgi:hypothetical protein
MKNTRLKHWGSENAAEVGVRGQRDSSCTKLSTRIFTFDPAINDSYILSFLLPQ